ncbi:MAG: hypothetical protein R2806_20660 [Saprospiraceae bacterium]
MPPLQSPFGEYTTRAGSTVLMEQVISKKSRRRITDLFHADENIKTGVLAAEGIWKWQLYDYLNHQDHQLIDELIDKTVQCLACRKTNGNFGFYLPKKIFRENEEVRMDAELYNESYELINDPDAFISIFNAKGKVSVYHGSAEISSIPASGIFSGRKLYLPGFHDPPNENLTFTGSFSIQPVQLEMYNRPLTAPSSEALARNRNGTVILPSTLNSLADQIRETHQDVKPVAYAQSVTQPLLMIKWLFYPLLSSRTGMVSPPVWGGY